MPTHWKPATTGSPQLTPTFSPFADLIRIPLKKLHLPDSTHLWSNPNFYEAWNTLNAFYVGDLLKEI
jgi:hypothetical protein